MDSPTSHPAKAEGGGSRWAAPRAGSWALPAAVFAAIILVLFALAPKGTSLDYAVFHRAGARWLRGEDLYRSSEFFSFKYAPIAAAFFAPFSLLPQPLGWLAMNALSTAVLLGVLRWGARQLRGAAHPGPLELALLLAMTAPYYGHLFWLGQTDGLVLGLLVASEAWAGRRPALSGGLWALACLVKPPFLTLLLPAVLLRQWRRLAGLCGGVALWLVLGCARYGVSGGWSQLHTWYATLSRQAPDLICWEFNQSAAAIACTYLARPGTRAFGAALAALALGVLAVGLGLAAAAGRDDPARRRFALFGLALYLGAFLSPLGWNTNLLSTIPLAGALASAAVEAPSTARSRAAAAAAAIVTLLNCVDLLLLPFHLWEDTAMTLLRYRQYGVAGLVLAGSALACLAARPGGAVVRSRPPASCAPGA
jgi:hypothetical protein